MARFDEGGGGGASIGSGLGNAISGISKAAKSAGRKSGKRRRSSGSGASSGVRQIRRGFDGVSRSVARQSRRQGTGRNGGGGNGYRAASGPQVSTPRPPVGNTPSGQIAASLPAPTPPPVSVEDFLAKDTAFRSQQSAYQKALADYAAQMQAEQGKYNGEFSAQTKQLGLDRTEGVTNLRDDYASRGLVNSGVFADALGDLNTKFDTSAADLERAKQAYMDDLTTGQTNFKTTQQTLLEKARQDALNRRLDSLKG